MSMSGRRSLASEVDVDAPLDREALPVGLGPKCWRFTLHRTFHAGTASQRVETGRQWATEKLRTAPLPSKHYAESNTTERRGTGGHNGAAVLVVGCLG